MAQGTLKVPKPELAHELRNPKSDLNKLVVFAGQLAEKESPGYRALVGEARSRLKRACDGYEFCKNEPNCLLCTSGEEGQPRRGELCKLCPVSQFSKSGKFVGEEPTGA